MTEEAEAARETRPWKLAQQARRAIVQVLADGRFRTREELAAIANAMGFQSVGVTRPNRANGGLISFWWINAVTGERVDSPNLEADWRGYVPPSQAPVIMIGATYNDNVVGRLRRAGIKVQPHFIPTVQERCDLMWEESQKAWTPQWRRAVLADALGKLGDPRARKIKVETTVRTTNEVWAHLGGTRPSLEEGQAWHPTVPTVRRDGTIKPIADRRILLVRTKTVQRSPPKPRTKTWTRVRYEAEGDAASTEAEAFYAWILRHKAVIR